MGMLEGLAQNATSPTVSRGMDGRRERRGEER
jgi:hypothetical protein